MLVKASDHHHGWNAGSRTSIPTPAAIEKVFDEIMSEGPFDDEEQEGQWWQQLPLVPAVTGVLLRQQNLYVPVILLTADIPLILLFFVAYRRLFESLASDRLRRLVIFENFNETYPAGYRNVKCDPMQIPSSYVNQAIANASLTLDHLSASFILDASDFFDARKFSWKWPNLTWLALTSRLLVPRESSMELDDMLRAAATAAIKMPRLETMEIWNGERDWRCSSGTSELSEGNLL